MGDGSQEATAQNRVGRPGWMGSEGPEPMGLALWLSGAGGGGGSVDYSPLPDRCPCPQLWVHAQG